MVVVLVVDVDVLVDVVVVVGAQEGHVAGDVQETLGRHR